MQRAIIITGTVRKQREEKLREIEIKFPDFKKTLKKNTLIMSFYKVLSSPV